MNPVHIDCQDYADELKEMLQCGVKYEMSGEILKTAEYEFTFSPEFLATTEVYKQFYNPLIYGKNTMLGIVALEISPEFL